MSGIRGYDVYGFGTGVDFFLPTYEQRLKECADTVTHFIMNSPKGTTFEIEKPAEGSTIPGNPILILKTRTELS